VNDDLLAYLSLDERARAARVLNAGKGELWARSRGVLRILLGRYLAVDPGSVRVRTDSGGKPALAPAHVGGRHSSDLHFNLSHSGTLALYAFTRGDRVGIDVELAGGQLDHAAIAGRAFGARESQRLRALPPSVRECEFLRAWVKREAVLKCRGTVGGGIRASGSARAREPRIAQLDLGPLALGAVALERRGLQMRYWAYREALEDPQRDRLSDPLAAYGGGHRHGHAAAMLAQ
jgi:phosphopantetheinyl transferase